LNPPDTLIASTGFAVLTPRDGNWAFLYAAATRRGIGAELGRLADGGAYPAIRPEVVGNVALVLPPDPDVPSSFQRLLAPLLGRPHRNREESKTLAALRDALLRKLVSGALPVNIVNDSATARSVQAW